MKLKALAMAALLAVSIPASAAWNLWDQFKGIDGLDASGRIIDRSDERKITTSEGQSYGMFFALVAGDRESFDKMASWMENNLAKGDVSKTLPMWLWGRRKDGGWGVIDTNNAADSDMWIAYDFLEAGRIWNEPKYTEKGRAMMKLIRTQVRNVANLGDVILPGRVGFEKEGTVVLNPSYYPLFILKRFALEDPSWKSVYDGSLRSLVRSSPSGIAPDWARFDKNGRLMKPEGEDYELGSYNAIRTYLWAGMMSKQDPAYAQLANLYKPMVRLTEQLNMPPEKVNVVTLEVNHPGNAGFGACLLPMLGNSRTAGLIRTVLAAEPVSRDSYYTNMLSLFGLGYDSGRFSFDRDGRVVLPAEQ
jgi:endoglucanase